MQFMIRRYRRFPFTYFFAFLSLIVLLFLSCVSGHAEWQSIGRSQDRKSIFVDPDSLHREGDLVELGYLFDYDTLQIKNDGFPPFTSQKYVSEYDCGKELRRFISGTDYSGHMAKGLVVLSHAEKVPWYQIAPRSVDHALWTFACSQK